VTWSIDWTGSTRAGTADLLQLKPETTVTLLLKSATDEPLEVASPLFHTHDWTLALWLTAMQFSDKNPITAAASSEAPPLQASFEQDAVQVFINETDLPLAEVVLTDYKYSKAGVTPNIIEAMARHISGDAFRAMTFPIRKGQHLFTQDSDVIFGTISQTINGFKSAGTEIGYTHVKEGVHQEGARGGGLELRGGDTTFRIGPLLQSIPPGDGIALVYRFHYNEYWEPITSSSQDWQGERAPYPLRLLILSIADNLTNFEFDPSSIVNDYTLRDGTHKSSLPGAVSKVSPRYLTEMMTLINQGTKGRFSWAWRSL
jgi:hypothetical protein